MARNRSPAIVIWLAIGVIALIAYGSLYPFDLKPDLKSGSDAIKWWQAIGQLSWARAGRSDHVANVLLYAPLGFCLALWFEGRMRHRVAVIVATICGALLSLSIEVAQVFISSRVPSWWDVTLNMCGACGGAFGGVAWGALTARLPNSLASGNHRGGPAWLVLLLWFAWRWTPFLPHFTLTKLKAALQPLLDPQITFALVAYYLVWWIALAQVVFVLTSAQRGVEMLLVAIAAVLVGRLFIVDLAFVPSELIALVLLLPTLVILHRLRAPARSLLLLGSFAAVFVFELLAPFSATSSAAHFDLWPFLAWMNEGMTWHLHALCKQLFEYAALIWLLKEAGVTMRIATWLVPIGVFALEVLALWMPGRAGSLTAPALALAVALTMRYISGESGHYRVSNDLTRQRARSR